MMFSLRKRLAAVAIAASSIVFGINAAHAVNITWSGAGNMGSDPFGQTWMADSFNWGMPGLGLGTVPWGGPDWISDFHITFDGRQIVQSPFLTEFGIDDNGDNLLDTFWTPMFMGTNTVWFVAPPSVQLDPGERFFVNVALSPSPAGTPVSFTAEYTMGQLPEPGTLMLFGLGLAGLGLVARRSSLLK